MENPTGKKRKRRGGEPEAASFDRHVFPILLAAVAPTAGPDQLAYNSSSFAAAARLLRRLLSRSPPSPALSPLPASLVALLPLLISSRYKTHSSFLSSQHRTLCSPLFC
jgi:lysine-specific demethylase/histidyl-hydroxylase NO66